MAMGVLLLRVFRKSVFPEKKVRFHRNPAGKHWQRAEPHLSRRRFPPRKNLVAEPSAVPAPGPLFPGRPALKAPGAVRRPPFPASLPCPRGRPQVYVHQKRILVVAPLPARKAPLPPPEKGFLLRAPSRASLVRPAREKPVPRPGPSPSGTGRSVRPECAPKVPRLFAGRALRYPRRGPCTGGDGDPGFT